MVSKYDKIGKNYDATRRADPILVSNLLRLFEPKPEKLYLDVACGSGNYTSEMARHAGSWTGLDQSMQMLGQARRKTDAVRFVCSDVDLLPFDSDTFDGAIISLAIHHFDCLKTAFSEVRRVISQGRFVIFTSTADQMKHYWLNEYFPDAMRLSINQMPTRHAIESAIDHAGLEVESYETYSVHSELSDYFLYSGKHEPTRYLSAEFRNGISTFSSLADAAEVEEGCKLLRQDIESGRIRKAVSRYANDLGDYCYFVCTTR